MSRRCSGDRIRRAKVSCTAPPLPAPMRSTGSAAGTALSAAGQHLYGSSSPLRSGIIRSAFSTATVIDRRGQCEPHSLLTARFTSSATGRSALCRSASTAKSAFAVKAFLIEAIDPYAVADAGFCRQRPPHGEVASPLTMPPNGSEPALYLSPGRIVANAPQIFRLADGILRPKTVAGTC